MNREQRRNKGEPKKAMAKNEFVPFYYALNEPEVTVPISEISRLLEDLLVKVNVLRDHAVSIAQVLLAAQFRGLHWFGIEHLDRYLKLIKSRLIDPQAKPRVIHDYELVTVVDGKNSLGFIIGNFCMKLAINKAKKSGIGFVVAKNSNFYGLGRLFTSQAQLHGFIAMAFSNDLPTVGHPKSKTGCIGSNNISMSAVGISGESYNVDLWTSVICKEKLEFSNKHKIPITLGIARNTDGQPTTSAEEALEACNLNPIGDKHSCVKGFGLCIMVDVLCAVLSDSDPSPFLQDYREVSKPMKLSQCFIVIDPSYFNPHFRRDLKDLLESIREVPPIDEEFPVNIPGDQEKRNTITSSTEGTIRLYESQVVYLKLTCSSISHRSNPY